MAFDRPALSTIIARIKADLEASLNLGSPALRRSNVAVFAKAFGGAAHMLHGHLDYLSKQIFVDSADTVYLDRYASIYGLSRKPADYAIGQVVFTGTDGSVIPAGTVLQRSDGIDYELDASGTVSGGSVSVAVTCLTAGEIGNADAATALTLGSPIAGVSSTANVDGDGLTGGLETETDEALRERILARIQDPPKGGAASDYEQWAVSVEGITRAFVFAGVLGPGTVSVYVVNDEATDPIPSSGKVAEVQDYIDSVRPVTAEVTVFAPVAVPVDISVAIYGDTPEIRAAITAELAALFKRESEVGGTIIRSHISEAISGASGEIDHVLSVPASNVAVSAGEFPVLGTITFSTLAAP